MQYLWIILLIGFIVLEAATTQFICIWFAGGALCSLICSILNLSVSVQWFVFIISSALLLVFTKKIVDKIKSAEPLKTNAEALIGQTAIVTENISNIDAKGRVKVRGMEWSARSADGDTIAKDSHVIVKEIDGVKLIVDKINN